MSMLLAAGLDYLRQGLSVVPATLDKRPVVPWRSYQTKPMTEPEMRQVFSRPAAKGIAIICGKVSGELEVLDIDAKNDPSGDLFPRFERECRRHLPISWNQLVIARTKNAGYHVYYRCPCAGRSAVLARRPTTATEQLAHPGIKALVLIEIRGNGGYVLADPTAGYAFIQGWPKDIPVLDAAERDALLAVAVSFNTYQPPVYLRNQPSLPVTRSGSPLDDYDGRGDAIGLLISHGWTFYKSDHVRTYLRRPGKTDHPYSGDFNHQLNRFGVFSPNTPFEVGKGYRPSAVYAILECQGDFRLAAKLLSLAGFGVVYKDQVR